MSERAVTSDSNYRTTLLQGKQKLKDYAFESCY